MANLTSEKQSVTEAINTVNSFHDSYYKESYYGDSTKGGAASVVVSGSIQTVTVSDEEFMNSNITPLSVMMSGSTGSEGISDQNGIFNCNFSFNFSTNIDLKLPNFNAPSPDYSLMYRVQDFTNEISLINDILINGIQSLGCCDVAEAYNRSIVPIFRWLADHEDIKNCTANPNDPDNDNSCGPKFGSPTFPKMILELNEVLIQAYLIVRPLVCLLRPLPGNPWFPFDIDQLYFVRYIVAYFDLYYDIFISGKILDPLIRPTKKIRENINKCINGGGCGESIFEKEINNVEDPTEIQCKFFVKKIVNQNKEINKLRDQRREIFGKAISIDPNNIPLDMGGNTSEYTLTYLNKIINNLLKIPNQKNEIKSVIVRDANYSEKELTTLINELKNSIDLLENFQKPFDDYGDNETSNEHLKKMFLYGAYEVLKNDINGLTCSKNEYSVSGKDLNCSSDKGSSKYFKCSCSIENVETTADGTEVGDVIYKKVFKANKNNVGITITYDAFDLKKIFFAPTEGSFYFSVISQLESARDELIDLMIDDIEKAIEISERILELVKLRNQNYNILKKIVKPNSLSGLPDTSFGLPNADKVNFDTVPCKPDKIKYNVMTTTSVETTERKTAELIYRFTDNENICDCLWDSMAAVFDKEGLVPIPETLEKFESEDDFSKFLNKTLVNVTYKDFVTKAYNKYKTQLKNIDKPINLSALAATPNCSQIKKFLIGVFNWDKSIFPKTIDDKKCKKLYNKNIKINKNTIKSIFNGYRKFISAQDIKKEVSEDVIKKLFINYLDNLSGLKTDKTTKDKTTKDIDYDDIAFILFVAYMDAIDSGDVTFMYTIEEKEEHPNSALLKLIDSPMFEINDMTYSHFDRNIIPTVNVKFSERISAQAFAEKYMIKVQDTFSTANNMVAQVQKEDYYNFQYAKNEAEKLIKLLSIYSSNKKYIEENVIDKKSSYIGESTIVQLRYANYLVYCRHVYDQFFNKYHPIDLINDPNESFMDAFYHHDYEEDLENIYLPYTIDKIIDEYIDKRKALLTTTVTSNSYKSAGGTPYGIPFKFDLVSSKDSNLTYAQLFYVRDLMQNEISSIMAWKRMLPSIETFLVWEKPDFSRICSCNFFCDFLQKIIDYILSLANKIVQFIYALITDWFWKTWIGQLIKFILMKVRCYMEILNLKDDFKNLRNIKESIYESLKNNIRLYVDNPKCFEKKLIENPTDPSINPPTKDPYDNIEDLINNYLNNQEEEKEASKNNGVAEDPKSEESYETESGDLVIKNSNPDVPPKIKAKVLPGTNQTRLGAKLTVIGDVNNLGTIKYTAHTFYQLEFKCNCEDSCVDCDDKIREETIKKIESIIN